MKALENLEKDWIGISTDPTNKFDIPSSSTRLLSAQQDVKAEINSHPAHGKMDFLSPTKRQLN